jgi:hypothetical protein
MTTSDLAAEIFCRVITDRILGNPKVWEVPEKQARDIAKAALDSAEVFAQVAWPGTTATFSPGAAQSAP